MEGSFGTAEGCCYCKRCCQTIRNDADMTSLVLQVLMAWAEVHIRMQPLAFLEKGYP